MKRPSNSAISPAIIAGMSEQSREQRREIHYAGHVQGVGFRFTTRSVASRFAVAGWVQNLPDGRVRVVVEGAPAELDEFQRALAQAMAGQIDHVEVKTVQAEGEFDSFEIRH